MKIQFINSDYTSRTNIGKVITEMNTKFKQVISYGYFYMTVKFLS